MENKINNQNTHNEEDNIDYSAILNNLKRNWKLFVLSFIVVFSFAALYLLIVQPEYKISAKVLINEKSGSSVDLLSSFKDLGFDVGVKNIDNEIVTLQTRFLAQTVADSLNLQVKYVHRNGLLKKEDLYNESPFFIDVVEFKGPRLIKYKVDKIDDNTLEMRNKEETLRVSFGDLVKTSKGSFNVRKNENGQDKYPIELSIYSQIPIPKINVENVSKYSSVLELSTIQTNPQKGQDIINTLISLYNKEAYLDKNLSARSTIDFIDTRLSIISGELESAEKNVENYKKDNKLTDLKADAEIYLATNSEYDKKLAQINLNLSVLSSIRSYLEDNKHKDNLVPSNMGIEDVTLFENIKNFNDAQLEKAKATRGLKADNPLVQNYEAQIDLLRRNLIENIKNVEAGFMIAKNEVLKQERLFSSKIANLSTQEREFRELYRQQNIKESLYVFLLQKKEETGLYLTAVVPNAKIIDHTYIPDSPVHPTKGLILIFALILSFIIPLIIIYIKNLLNYKVSDENDLNILSNIPNLGDIPATKNKLLEVDEGETVLSEKFRTNCINLDFVFNGEKNKIILVTSSLSGEGKTYYSTNLAIALSNIGKKVLLINWDLHKVDGINLVKTPKNNGLSTYLIQDITLEDIIYKSPDYKNLSVINNGPIPPNPAVLINSPKLEEAFKQLKPQFDYIVVDTPPIGLMADVMMINKFSDLVIYVIRQHYTPKKMLNFIQNLHDSNKLSNLHTVFNDVDLKNAYGEYYDKKYNRYY